MKDNEIQKRGLSDAALEKSAVHWQKAKRTIDTRTEPQARLPKYEVMLTDLT